MKLKTARDSLKNTYIIGNLLFLMFLLDSNSNKLKVSLIIIISMSLYYLLNIFNFDCERFKKREILFMTFSNTLLLFFLTIDAHIDITWYKLALIFTGIFIYQLGFKISILKFFTRKLNIYLVGDNEKTDYLKDRLKEDSIYQIGKKEDFDILVDTCKMSINSNIDDYLEYRCKGKVIYNYSGFLELLDHKIPVKEIEKKYFIYEAGFYITHNKFEQKLKRLVDIVCSLIILSITWPIMLISGIIVKLESRGPAIFKQSRIGLNGHEYMLYKFRSMRLHDEDKYSKYSQGASDNRITKFGKFMRKSRIDELPQVFNILKGEMSFVGPRPEWDKLGREYEQKLPYYKLRYMVKPGATGWAQINYPYGANLEDTLRKLEYDLYYIRKQNFLMDVQVLFETVKVVLFGKGH